MVKIFLTGATGYVGGDVLYALTTNNTSQHNISCLVRDAAKATSVAKAYPNIRIVQGDLADSALVEKEARNADIIVHLAATSHISSSTAITEGLKSSERESTGYWIQISGATLLAAKEIAEGTFGRESDKTYDDVENTNEIISAITSNPNRAVDNLVLVQSPSIVKTALIVAPHIYGLGRGPGNTRSIQAPEYVRSTLKLKAGFRLAEGKNTWSTVHVRDLSDLILSLITAAAERRSGHWNETGIYLPENGRMAFGVLGAKIAQAAHERGLIASPIIAKAIDTKEADSLSAHASILWGTNAIVKSSRARQSLDWKPHQITLEAYISDLVRVEAGKIG